MEYFLLGAIIVIAIQLGLMDHKLDKILERASKRSSNVIENEESKEVRLTNQRKTSLEEAKNINRHNRGITY